MAHIQEAAAHKMHAALARFPDGTYSRTDHLDDGSPICVSLVKRGESVRVDFTGTGPVLATNLNANRAIVTAAVLYVFRCLIGEEIPLNAGVLEPLEIILPTCLLNPGPADDPANRPPSSAATWKPHSASWMCCWCAGNGGGEPGYDEQPHLWRRDVRLLRDDLRRKRCDC